MDNGSKKVCVVIVAYNDVSYLIRCIDSVYNSDYQNLEIVVVDNSSTDLIRSELCDWPNLHYQKMITNTGFCEGNNVGIQKSIEKGCDYTLLLNHDTKINRSCIGELVARAETDSKIGAVTGKIFLMSGKNILWYAGGYYSKLLAVGKNYGYNSPDLGQYDFPKEVTYSTGCCMLIRNEVFKEVGMLDVTLFMYYEDVKFGNVLRERGYKIYYEPKAILQHELGGGAVVSKRPAYYLYFSLRNRPLSVKGLVFKGYVHVLCLFLAALKIAQFLTYKNVSHRFSKVLALVWGVVDGFSEKPRYRVRFPQLFG